jgi:hypothetical protein
MSPLMQLSGVPNRNRPGFPIPRIRYRFLDPPPDSRLPATSGQILGERPSDPTKAAAWDRTVRGSEGYRVRNGSGAIQGRGDKGLLITTGNFSSAAREEATRDGALPIDLIDGEQLCDLLREHRLGVETTTRTIEEVHVQRDFFNRQSNKNA